MLSDEEIKAGVTSFFNCNWISSSLIWFKISNKYCGLKDILKSSWLYFISNSSSAKLPSFVMADNFTLFSVMNNFKVLWSLVIITVATLSIASENPFLLIVAILLLSWGIMLF